MTDQSERLNVRRHGARVYGRWLDQHLPWWLNIALFPAHLLVMLVLAVIYNLWPEGRDTGGDDD